MEIKRVMRKLKDNNYGSAVPIILYIVAIVGLGALYTLLFIEIGIPSFSSFIPASDSKTFIMMCIYAIPMFILGVGSIALVKSGLKVGGY
jgi:hypothetical protein